MGLHQTADELSLVLVMFSSHHDEQLLKRRCSDGKNQGAGDNRASWEAWHLKGSVTTSGRTRAICSNRDRTGECCPKRKTPGTQRQSMRNLAQSVTHMEENSGDKRVQWGRQWSIKHAECGLFSVFTQFVAESGSQDTGIPIAMGYLGCQLRRSWGQLKDTLLGGCEGISWRETLRAETPLLPQSGQHLW